jgi:SAM-dependent methyltransferase
MGRATSPCSLAFCVPSGYDGSLDGNPGRQTMTSFRSSCYERYISSGQAPGTGMLDAEKRAWYDYHFGPFLRGWQADEPVLELGCGSGDFLAYLKERGLQHVQGVDISAEQAALARNRGLEVVAEDAFDVLRRNEGRFGAIAAFDFLEHFSRDELFELLPLIRAALRPKGNLLIQTPNGAGIFAPQIMFGDLTHLTILTEDSFCQLARLHGFASIQLAESGPVPKGLKGVARWFLWRLFRGVFAFGKRLESGRWQQLWSANLIAHCQRNEDARGPSTSQE